MSAAIVGAVIGAGATIYTANQQSKSANRAANAQEEAAMRAMAVQQEQYQRMLDFLNPYATQGTNAFNQQSNLIGSNGVQAQTDAIANLKQSAQFDALEKSGQNAILQNASATGGLRGGNVQGALAQFSPQLLSGLIQQQFGNLGQLSNSGMQAIGMLGNVSTNSANQISGLQQQYGAAEAGNALAQGKANASLGNYFQGLGGYAMSRFGVNSTPSGNNYTGWGGTVQDPWYG